MEKSINSRIEEELQRINVWFSDLDENELAIVEPLLENAAFMKVTLDDLQERIKEEGVVDQYMNGANQYGQKQSAALQSYNTLVKNYAAVNKTLLSYLPKMKPKPPAEKSKEEVAQEIAERIREDDAKRARINREIEEAARWQREQWAKEGRPGYSV